MNFPRIRAKKRVAAAGKRASVGCVDTDFSENYIERDREAKGSTVLDHVASRISLRIGGREINWFCRHVESICVDLTPRRCVRDEYRMKPR